MKRRVLELPLTLAKSASKCDAIVEAISAQIRRGVLGPGAALPGSRALAHTLGVHRNTVVAAYAELEREGWIATRPRAGTCVAADLPQSPGAAPTPPLLPVQSIQVAKPLRWDLAGGLGDVRLAPTRELAAAIRRVCAKPRRVLLEADPRGSKALRAAIPQYLTEVRGWTPLPTDVMTTRGSQMALWLLASAVSEASSRAGRIAVESPGYKPAWNAFATAGLEVVYVPVDRHGLNLDALVRAHKVKPISAVYVTPHHQYPTTVTMPAPRRLRLIALARQYGWQIIEDDYDHEFHYEGRPIPPLATLAPDCVHYVGTFSKLVGPGFRLGFMVSPLVRGSRLAEIRSCIDRQGDPWLEDAFAALIDDGTLLRHARRARRVYHARRDNMVALLSATFGENMTLQVPDGGLSLWAKAARQINVTRLHHEAAERGIHFHLGQHFYPRANVRPTLRLGFANLTEAEQSTAIGLWRLWGRSWK